MNPSFPFSSPSSSSSSSFFFTLTIIFCSLDSLRFANRLVQQTCKNCSRADPNISYKICVASFESNHRSEHTGNLEELGLIFTKITIHNVMETSARINDLLEKNKSFDPFIKKCLYDCLEVYSDTITTFREAIRDYKAKRNSDCNVKLRSIIDASTTCEDGFKQNNNGAISPLTKRNKDTFQLSAIALSIINMLINSDV